MKTTEMTFEELRVQREALNEEWENRRIAAWDNILKAFEDYIKQFGAIKYRTADYTFTQNPDDEWDYTFDDIRRTMTEVGVYEEIG